MVSPARKQSDRSTTGSEASDRIGLIGLPTDILNARFAASGWIVRPLFRDGAANSRSRPWLIGSGSPAEPRRGGGDAALLSTVDVVHLATVARKSGAGEAILRAEEAILR